MSQSLNEPVIDELMFLQMVDMAIVDYEPVIDELMCLQLVDMAIIDYEPVIE